MPQLDFDGANSRLSADNIRGQSGSTIYIVSGHNLVGSGSGLTALNATQLTSGTLPIARIADDAVTLAKMADDAIGVAQLSATGTASNSTFLRGDNSWAAAGGGKILQVVTATKSDTFTTTNTSMTDITGLTVNITPAATSSKILVLSAVKGSQDVNAGRGYLRLMRDSTAIFVGDTAASRLRGSGSFWSGHSTVASPTVSSCYVDSPSSTSALTYKWQGARSAGTGTFFINRTEADGDETGQIRMASTITVMEIGA